MVRGIGNDIIEISRIKASIARHERRFLDKIFTPNEQAYCLRYRDPTPNFAGFFAAKEAIVKALGTGFRSEITWLDIEISHDHLGKPEPVLSSRLNAAFCNPQILISISHCREYATATALLL